MAAIAAETTIDDNSGVDTFDAIEVRQPAPAVRDRLCAGHPAELNIEQAE
jgi:hypothetical protein